MPRAALLELDGVLVDVVGARADALAAALAAEGIATDRSAPVGPVNWHASFDDLARAVPAAAALDDTALALVALRAERDYASRVASGVTLAPGVREALARVAAGWRLGVVTAWRRVDAERVLAHAGLDAVVRFVAAADDGPPFPSAVERVRRALHRLAPVAAAGVVVAMVASPAAHGAARAAGARTVLVPTADSAVRALEQLAPMPPSSDPAVIPISSAHARDRGAEHAPDVAAQYAALRTGALFVDHAGRDLWTFRGPKAAETVSGLVTNDLAGLAPGHGGYAAALTAKGRIVADVRAFACDAGAGAGWLEGVALVVDVPSRAADGWGGIVRKFINPRSAPYRHERDRLRAFGVYGARARDAVAEAFGAPPAALAALTPYAHATVQLDGAPLLVARVPDLGLDGFLIVGPADHRDAAWERVRRAAPGGVVGGEAAYAIARIEAGYPEWGVDVDDTTIPQEANLDDLHAISYTKGCYTGQEVVARIHFRGHVNRHLRGVAYASDAGAIPTGAELVDEGGKVVGDVRSSAISPRLGGVAIGMIRREVALGATLRARWSEGDGGPAERAVTVSALPFAVVATAG